MKKGKDAFAKISSINNDYLVKDMTYLTYGEIMTK